MDDPITILDEAQYRAMQLMLKCVELRERIRLGHRVKQSEIATLIADIDTAAWLALVAESRTLAAQEQERRWSQASALRKLWAFFTRAAPPISDE